MHSQDLLTVDELALALKVKKSWIYGETRKRDKRAIPHLKVGKYRRFFLPEVLAWLKEIQNES